MIESYSFGKIVINGKTYTSDVIVYLDRVKGSWWRKSGHLLQKDDINDVLQYEPEILIVGTGAQGLMDITEETKQLVKSKGIELIAKETDEACRIYNELKKKRKVVAILHLTC
ncbi:MAG: hypothetical protein JSW60_04290 [Thermoplasmatales archaeon]|nr:MAG: hypothetical protein JSW60_04290 [Thermoplasmatales archaeon]